jgi:CDP-4-dehydro-6-deoxyglucose reductase, E3
MPPPPPFPVRLVSGRPLTPTVRELTFERSDGQPMTHRPGQWVNLAIERPEGGELLRAYSIASPPDGTPRFELAVTRVPDGPGSGFLHGLAPGAELRALGPHGFFTREPAESCPSLLIATGTGLTPLRSMLRAALSAGAAEPIWLLVGVRGEPDMLYRDEFEALSARHPNLRVFFSLSRPPPGWGGLSGYVQTHVPELWRQLGEASAGVEPHLFICGLERMVSVVRTLGRKELGLARTRVHSERYD